MSVCECEQGFSRERTAEKKGVCDGLCMVRTKMYVSVVCCDHTEVRGVAGLIPASDVARGDI